MCVFVQLYTCERAHAYVDRESFPRTTIHVHSARTCTCTWIVDCENGGREGGRKEDTHAPNINVYGGKYLAVQEDVARLHVAMDDSFLRVQVGHRLEHLRRRRDTAVTSCHCSISVCAGRPSPRAPAQLGV
jgi:hypothetical protein